MVNHPNRNRGARVIIRTVGNPDLRQSLRDRIASETHHRSASGAARRLVEIARQEREWSAVMGKWGTVEIEVDGEALDHMDVVSCMADAQEAAFGDDAEHYPAIQSIRTMLAQAIDLK